MTTSIRRYPAIEHREERRDYPLSYQQERVLYLDQLAPGGALWNLISAKRLTGRLNAAAMRGAVEELAERHAALRTKIELAQPPVQSFGSFSPEQFRLADLSQGDPDSREQALAEWFSRECREPIAIREGDPLFQAILVPCGADEALLVLKLHHIVSDATTFQLLWRDLKTLYNRRTGAEADELPQSGIAYGDYALWQKEMFGEERTLEQEAYWLEQFKGELPVLDLPTDFPPPPGISFRGGLEKLELPNELIGRLKFQCLNKRVILFSALLSAYYVLLHKCSRQDDVVVGTVFAGRHYSQELSRAAGFFVNTVAIRTEVDGEGTWEDLMKTVHGKVDEAYYMQDYPFERLVRKLNPDRQHSRNPLFRVMFNMVTEAKEEGGFADLTETWQEAESDATQADLLFDIRQREGETAVWAEYNSDLFRPETVRRLLKMYGNLLEDIADRPDARVKELRMTDAAEREKLLKEFNDTRTAYPSDKCVHELFEEQVSRTPDAIALSGAGTVWTYAELNARSNRLARTLQSRGIGPESVVAILAGRSPHMILGILAILKAGGAYLPIDPSYPPERIEFMLRDSGAALVLVQAGIPGQSNTWIEAGYAGIELVKVDVQQDGAIDSGAPDCANLVNTSKPDTLAYIMYTSGSTGQPKGVMVEHRNVVRLVKNGGYIELQEGMRILLTGSPSFDATTFEIWGALLNGLTLYVAEEDVLLRADKLGAFVAEHQMDLLFLTTPLFRQLAEQKPDLFKPLTALLVGGDVLPSKPAARVREACPGLTLLNMYGPTENTTFTTFHRVGEETGSRVPIGKPIANTTVYIMDGYGNLLPPGVAGELCIGGDGLARGYMNRPDLNTEKFRSAAFLPDERLYRSGDLARWLPDGSIEFLGRIDQQVKIRGYRIEPGEIERVLISHPGIREAVVVVNETRDGEKRIVAYLVLQEAGKGSAQTWRTFLEGHLPSYMIPSLFIPLDSLVLKANGKVDLAALPDPGEAPVLYGAEKQAPQSDTEQKLAELIKKVLHLGEVSMNDNLYLLGGNSLLFINVAMEVEKLFHVELSIMDVMESATVRELSAKVEQLLGDDLLLNR